jgi:hypothetical protein
MLFCVVFVQCSGCLQISRCEVVLLLLLVASGSVLIFKPLPSIKIWYAFGILSKKKNFLQEGAAMSYIHRLQ